MSLVDEAKEISPVFKKAIEAAENALPYYNYANWGIKAITGKDIKDHLGIFGEPTNLPSPFYELTQALGDISDSLNDIYCGVENIQKRLMSWEEKTDRSDIYNINNYIETTARNGYRYITDPNKDKPEGEINKNQFEEQLAESEPKLMQLAYNPDYWRRIYVGRTKDPNVNDPYPGTYSDVWSGPLDPPLEVDGKYVWDYRLALPATLKAIGDWSICLLAAGNSFRDLHRNDVIGILERIQGSINKILKEGFQPLEPPDKGWYARACMEANSKDKFSNWGKSDNIYGLVEKFTGVACTANWPTEELIQGAAFISIVADEIDPTYTRPVIDPKLWDLYDKFVLMHRLRTLKMARKMSQELGLQNIRNIILQHCFALNMPTDMGTFKLPPEWNKYVVLPSLRDLFYIIPESIRGPPVGYTFEQMRPISMRKAANMIGTKSPISFRRMVFEDE
ncbi:MAG TPA: hypothetical protein PLK88_00315 [Methanothrix sp.]|nr:hypothetical protein [Methanothrix sp.]HQJ78912.1 hypothetical protein [Methanothrix sp.]